ncbi:hypothetical protein ACTOB_005463 [Actinoplanes oblitus]|uniref:Uncharacterized protein n=1 Tax=Actinoplanes oblitus TaxID=3040509 RepID=A0ABY8W8U9_9ACTN|nr:hypothetical protein [Actinoplanes oblitus]WIM93483.1 hypothetical protein ACTOB_005463 [Actinoplanes oblitus]
MTLPEHPLLALDGLFLSVAALALALAYVLLRRRRRGRGVRLFGRPVRRPLLTASVLLSTGAIALLRVGGRYLPAAWDEGRSVAEVFFTLMFVVLMLIVLALNARRPG